jgi:hypothetical protein
MIRLEKDDTSFAIVYVMDDGQALTIARCWDLSLAKVLLSATKGYMKG